MKRIIVGIILVAMISMLMSCLVVDTPKSNSKAISTFTLLSPPATGTINDSNHTIVVAVPIGTDVTSLVPTISHTGESISQASGEAINFTNPVVYTVTAADSSTCLLIVTVENLDIYAGGFSIVGDVV